MGKTFDFGPAPAYIDLTLRGRTPSGVDWVETFYALPRAPAQATLDLFRAARFDADGNPIPDVEAAERYLQQAMHPESWPRFQALMKDPERLFGMDQLNQVLEYLIEENTQRPTERPSTSPGGPPPSTATTPPATAPPPVLPPVATP